MTDLEQEFKRRWDCEIEEKSDLAPIKEAENKGDLEKLNHAVGTVKENHELEETVKSGIWVFRITWNDKVERVQISCYGYKAGITYEGGSE